YTTVFDVTQSGFRYWWLPAAGLMFIAVGAGMFVFSGRRLFATFILLFACFWTLISLASTTSDYFGLATALRHNHCELVEDRVEDFVPMPYQGHKDESFVVAGH